jgi:hypothetical protein
MAKLAYGSRMTVIDNGNGNGNGNSNSNSNVLPFEWERGGVRPGSHFFTETR